VSNLATLIANGGIRSVEEDTTPVLGGNLEGGGNNITNVANITLTGNITASNFSGTNTGDEVAASTTIAGVSELATSAEIDTGSDNTRTITPLGLAGSALQTKVDGIETAATADQSDSEIETAYNNQVSIVSQEEAEAGAATTVRRWTAQRVAQSAAAAAAAEGAPSWAIKTSAYTAVSSDHLACNTSGGAFTVTLPATPSANDYVSFADYGQSWGTNNLTIARNSVNIEGAASDLVYSTTGAPFTLTYIDATKGWIRTR
jgi:hypothetical protein